MKKRGFFCFLTVLFLAFPAFGSKEPALLEVLSDVNRNPRRVMERLSRMQTPEAQAEYALLLLVYGDEVEKKKIIPELVDKIAARHGGLDMHSSCMEGNSPADWSIWDFSSCMGGAVDRSRLYLPCKTALDLKIAFLNNTCRFDDKFKIPDELEEYISFAVPLGTGSNALYYDNAARYFPDFRIQGRKSRVPNGIMMLAGYDSLKKYREFLTHGIGFEEASRRLQRHYRKLRTNKPLKSDAAKIVLSSNLPFEKDPVPTDILRYKIASGASAADIKAFLEEHRDKGKIIREPDLRPHPMDPILHFAVFRPDILELLLQFCPYEKNYGYCQELSTNPDALNAKGETPLITAARHGFADSVAVLRRYGADEKLADRDGRTAAFYLSSSRQDSVRESSSQKPALPVREMPLRPESALSDKKAVRSEDAALTSGKKNLSQAAVHPDERGIQPQALSRSGEQNLSPRKAARPDERKALRQPRENSESPVAEKGY